MSQGQELWSHFKRLVVVRSLGHFKQGSRWGKSSQYPVDQAVTKSMDQELEKGRQLGGTEAAGLGAWNEGVNLKQPTSIFCFTRKGLMYKLHGTSQSFPQCG